MILFMKKQFAKEIRKKNRIVQNDTQRPSFFRRLLIISAICYLFAGGCAMSQIQLSKTQPAVFSWSPDDLSVLQNLSKLSIGTIFQEIPKGREEATLKLLSDYDVYFALWRSDDGSE